MEIVELNQSLPKTRSGGESDFLTLCRRVGRANPTLRQCRQGGSILAACHLADWDGRQSVGAGKQLLGRLSAVNSEAGLDKSL